MRFESPRPRSMKTAAEPSGSDGDLIGALERASNRLDKTPPADEIMFEEQAPQPLMVESFTPKSAVAADRPATGDEPATAASTLRVNVDTLEQLLSMVSELVLTRNQLLEVSRQQSGHAFSSPLQRLSQVTTQLQDCVMKTRMQPIDTAWQKLPRFGLVRA